MKLWLDDTRPAPEGWLHAKTVPEAKEAIENGLTSSEGFEEASLDHDLGICDTCAHTLSIFSSLNCVHNGTGLDLVRWMAEYGLWPVQKPLVHSWNPSGKQAMEAVIERHFPNRDKKP